MKTLPFSVSIPRAVIGPLVQMEETWPAMSTNTRAAHVARDPDSSEATEIKSVHAATVSEQFAPSVLPDDSGEIDRFCRFEEQHRLLLLRNFSLTR